MLGGLEHHGAPRRQRRCELPSAEGEREVPRHDCGDDTGRLAGDQRQLALLGWRDLARFLVRKLAVEAEAANQRPKLDLVRVADRLAHLEADQQGDFLAMLLDEIGEALQDLASSAWVQPRPDTMIKCRTGYGHGGICIGGLCPGEIDQRRAIPRRSHRAGRAIDRRSALATDEHALGDRGVGGELPPIRGFNRVRHRAFTQAFRGLTNRSNLNTFGP